MQVAFFGTPEFAAEFLKGLVADPELKVVAVVTQPDEPAGRKRILTPPPVKAVALEKNIPVLQPTKLADKDFIQQLKATGAEIGVVVAYGRLLPESLMSALPQGVINVHPSLLPKWRGPSPIMAAISAGDKTTGVSIIKLVKEMDAGPVLAQTPISITADETTAGLTDKVVEIGVPLLVSTLKGFTQGQIEPVAQIDSQATFCKLLTREDGKIDWSESAEAIERKVRAYQPWPGTFSDNLKIFAVKLSDLKLSPGEQHIDKDRLFIGTSTVALEILALQPAGGKHMSAADYLRGLRS